MKNLNLIDQKILCSFLTIFRKVKHHYRKQRIYNKILKKYLKEIRKVNKSAKQKKTLANINVLFNGRNKAIKFIEDYGSMILEAKRLAKQEGTGLKILPPKQMPQRLPIALAQIKAGDNSESLWNQIRQIVYSFYQSKEITKKVCNNIIKSIKV